MAVDYTIPKEEYSELLRLVRDMHAALQACCEAQDEHGMGCPMWPSRERECDLRDIEARMRKLGIQDSEE